ncbi:hypothetical protein M9H77_03128 [Catharanthus roseus]|uniref:Uncharacterized protein n=1 Tax=Catharanthus roseus TaxID=4058 RepID=A0ACC0CAI7_CATRO|nr:hypothetical protein M9H77_03128 [Catharanthus roseus]
MARSLFSYMNLCFAGQILHIREREYAKGGYYGNLGYQEYDEGISNYQIRQSCWKRNECWEEILEWVMRAMKVLDIRTWMMDMGIGIYMSKKLGVENKEERMLGVLENKGKSSKKELCIIHRDITLSFSPTPFSLCHEVSLRELEMLLVAYTSHVSIFGELCAI